MARARLCWPCRRRGLDAAFRTNIQRIAADFRDRAYLAASRRYRADDARRLRALADLPAADGRHQRRALPRPGATRAAGRDDLHPARLPHRRSRAGAAAQRRAPPQAARRDGAAVPRSIPHAIARTLEIVARCRFSLDEIAYEYPDEPVPPGLTPDEHLADLTWEGAAARYPAGIPGRCARRRWTRNCA